jgi:5-formyltetrahydrofolate cyclo-ligase
MSAFSDEKQAIRKQLLANRLSRPRPADFSLFALELLESTQGPVASYWSTETEPATTKINDYLQQSGRLALPAISGLSLKWTIPENLIPSRFGIMSPVGNTISISEVEIVLAPALAVSKTGARLGKGGGYYDRALENYSGKIFPLVFESEFVDYLPIEEHDKKVHGVITEIGLRVF